MAKKETLSTIKLVKKLEDMSNLLYARVYMYSRKTRLLPVYLASNGISLLNQYLYQSNTNKGCNP